MIYAINYDLKKQGQDYSGLYGAIKALGSWWHYLGSTWLVDTSLDANQIVERLTPHFDGNDRLLVIKMGNDRQGLLPEKAWDWITARE
ncbi:hypothetical protein [Rhizobium leguminosarum]|uniref:hypothetical protein n=1 Tax=Rhizobium leguminosarum TaxID=384 RepID=UPI00143F1883|nr:hypothetical protein [Rhizobium leguminosarum]NKL18482.1 hypothetical protein [Rhizobium leguminosarum bv. viciae]